MATKLMPSSNVAWFRYVLLIGLAVGLEGGGPGRPTPFGSNGGTSSGAEGGAAVGEPRGVEPLRAGARRAPALPRPVPRGERPGRGSEIVGDWRGRRRWPGGRYLFLGQYRAAIDARQQALDAAEAAMTVAVDLYQAMGASAWLRQAEAAWSGAG